MNIHDDLNLEESLEWIRNYGAATRHGNRQVITWSFDHLRADLGQVEILDWDSDERPMNSRTLHCKRPCAPYGHFHLIRDKEWVV